MIALRQQIEALRSNLAQLTAERDSIRSAPVDRETVERRIDYEIAKAKVDASNYFAHLGSPGGGFSVATFNRLAAADLFSFLSLFDPDGLREVALSRMRPGGLSDAERSKRLATAEAALAEAEIDEELALRKIDAVTGSHERRRLDANPAVLLAPLAELEEAAKPTRAGLLRKAS